MTEILRALLGLTGRRMAGLLACTIGMIAMVCAVALGAYAVASGFLSLLFLLVIYGLIQIRRSQLELLRHLERRPLATKHKLIGVEKKLIGMEETLKAMERDLQREDEKLQTLLHDAVERLHFAQKQLLSSIEEADRHRRMEARGFREVGISKEG